MAKYDELLDDVYAYLEAEGSGSSGADTKQDKDRKKEKERADKFINDVMELSENIAEYASDAETEIQKGLYKSAKQDLDKAAAGITKLEGMLRSTPKFDPEDDTKAKRILRGVGKAATAIGSVASLVGFGTEKGAVTAGGVATAIAGLAAWNAGASKGLSLSMAAANEIIDNCEKGIERMKKVVNILREELDKAQRDENRKNRQDDRTIRIDRTVRKHKDNNSSVKEEELAV